MSRILFSVLLSSALVASSNSRILQATEVCQYHPAADPQLMLADWSHTPALCTAGRRADGLIKQWHPTIIVICIPTSVHPVYITLPPHMHC